MLNLLKEKYVPVKSSESVRFLVVGFSATVLQFLFSWWFLWLGLRPAIAALLAFCLAFIFAYNSHRSWTYATTMRHRVLLPRYIAAQLVCALSVAMVTELTISFHFSNVVSAMCATLVSATLAYFLTSRWVFVG